MLYLILQEVLSKHPESINTRDKDGATALHYAASRGNAATAKLLLDRGAEVNARTTNEIQAPFGSAVKPLYIGLEQMQLNFSLLEEQT